MTERKAESLSAIMRWTLGPPHPPTRHSEICMLFKGLVECGTNPPSFIGPGMLPIGQP